MADKSKKIIRDTLLQLMKNHDFHEITIAELCAWGGLSRSTFYNHFSTKEDVILWTSKSIISNYLEDCVPVSDDWVEKLVYYFFKQSFANQEYLSLLMKHRLFHLHRIALLEICFVHKNIISQQLYLDLPIHMRRFLVRAYVDSSLTFYEEWKLTDFAMSIDDLTKMYLDIIHNPNR